MIKNAIIWRESVYKAGFRCKVCGTKLAEETGDPIDTLLDTKTNAVFCPGCLTCVAVIREMDVPEDMTGLQGNIHDYRKER